MVRELSREIAIVERARALSTRIRKLQNELRTIPQG
jgi:hypothetical protein